MPDVRGWRKKFGVLAPSTNTMVEPDFYMMGVPGVTAHISRIYMANTRRHGDNTEATDQRQTPYGIFLREPKKYLADSTFCLTMRGSAHPPYLWRSLLSTNGNPSWTLT